MGGTVLVKVISVTSDTSRSKDTTNNKTLTHNKPTSSSREGPVEQDETSSDRKAEVTNPKNTFPGLHPKKTGETSTT